MHKLLFIARLLFIVAFLALSILPLTNFNLKGERSLLENRVLAKAPRFPKLKHGELKIFPNQCEAWLQDRAGFREKMVAFYTGFHYYVFRTLPPQKKVRVGRGGELFLADRFTNNAEIVIFDNIKGLEEFRPIADSKLLKDIVELKGLADNLSVPTKAIIIPQKSLLEVHNLPYYVRRFISTPPPPPPPPAYPRLATLQLKDALPPEVAEWIIYPYEEAIHENTIHPLYPKMNFHWGIGRYTKLMASVIASEFGVAEYEPPGLEEFERCAVKSDLTSYAGYMFYDYDQLCIKKGVFEEMGIEFARNDSFEGLHYVYAVNKNKPSAPKIMWLGDSFSSFVPKDLARYFSEALAINIYLLKYADKKSQAEIASIMNQIVADYKPDYIVFAVFSFYNLDILETSLRSLTFSYR